MHSKADDVAGHALRSYGTFGSSRDLDNRVSQEERLSLLVKGTRVTLKDGTIQWRELKPGALRLNLRHSLIKHLPPSERERLRELLYEHVFHVQAVPAEDGDSYRLLIFASDPDSGDDRLVMVKAEIAVGAYGQAETKSVSYGSGLRQSKPANSATIRDHFPEYNDYQISVWRSSSDPRFVLKQEGNDRCLACASTKLPSGDYGVFLEPALAEGVHETVNKKSLVLQLMELLEVTPISYVVREQSGTYRVFEGVSCTLDQLDPLLEENQPWQVATAVCAALAKLHNHARPTAMLRLQPTDIGITLTEETAGRAWLLHTDLATDVALWADLVESFRTMQQIATKYQDGDVLSAKEREHLLILIGTPLEKIGHLPTTFVNTLREYAELLQQRCASSGAPEVTALKIHIERLLASLEGQALGSIDWRPIVERLTLMIYALPQDPRKIDIWDLGVLLSQLGIDDIAQTCLESNPSQRPDIAALITRLRHG